MKKSAFVLLVVTFLGCLTALAQDALEAPVLDMAAENPLQDVDIGIGNQQASVLFTYWERKAISNAIAQRGVKVSEIDDFVEPTQGLEVAEPPPPEPGERELRLSGLVYTNANDWIVWLNDTEIRPGEIPENAVAMTVKEKYIDIQWFDEYTNQIFPVRLRVGQRFNLDMRTFLPGFDAGGAPIPPPPPPEENVGASYQQQQQPAPPSTNYYGAPSNSGNLLESLIR